MASKSNSELWAENREYKRDLADERKKTAALMAELDKMQAELDKVSVGTDALEYEIKRLQKELAKGVSDKKLAQERRIAYNRGYQEGRQAR